VGRRGGETNLAAVGPGQLSLIIDDVKFDKYASTLKLHLATTTEVRLESTWDGDDRTRADAADATVPREVTMPMSAPHLTVRE